MDVEAWLRDLGLGDYVEVFRDNEIDGALLPTLTAEDLRDLGVTVVGHRRRLLNAIATLVRAGGPEAPPTEAVDAPAPVAEARAAERRQLTVMFVDLVGSTALSARLDPEDMREVVRDYQNTCAGIVTRFEGHVAQFLGDGVLAFFGWPRAHEDDAERAVRAGLAILDALAAPRPPPAPSLQVRIGIATGLVVVGDLIDEAGTQEGAVSGETPNLAARLQALAEPGSLVVAPGTRRLIGGLFALADLGERRLKGFAEPVRIWRVEGERHGEGRFEALRGGRLTPLVGREHELAILLERWAWARQGDGQVVLISGEPGIGKSRLVRAVRDQLSAQAHVTLNHFCSPHHTNIALYPVIGLLERAAVFVHDDPPGVRLDKLEALLARALDEVGEATLLLADLLSIPSQGRHPPLQLTPQLKKERTFAVLLQQLAGLAAKGPTLVVFEDVHWIDPTSLAFLDRLVAQVQRLPVLLIVSHRPEFAAPWPDHPHVTPLALARLPPAVGTAMIAQLTGGKPIPDAARALILAKTDGVPLFVEESTKALLESGLLRATGDGYELAGPLSDLRVPSTLHDLLLERLDRLSPARYVAPICAVLGRQFPYELLAAVAPVAEPDLRAALRVLCDAELLFQRGTPPDATYIFKHALVQDAAYSTLLRSRRQALHRQTGRAIERLYAGREDEACHLLAHHFAAADQPEEAVHYLLRLADRLARSYALAEMEATLRQGLGFADALGSGPERTRRRLQLEQRLSHCLYLLARFEESAQVLLDERELLEAGEDPTTTGPCLFALGHILLRLARYDEAARAARKAIEQAERCGDVTTAGKAHGALCFHGSLVGDAAAGTAAGERSIALLSSVDEPYWLGMTHFYQGMVDIPIGNFDGAIERGHTVVGIGESCGDARLQTYGGFLRGWALANQGEHARAERACRGAVELAPDPTSRAYASSFLAYTLLEGGDPRAALPALTAAVDAIRAVNFGPFIGYFQAMLAEAQRLIGDPAEATVTAERAIEAATTYYYPLGLGWAQRAAAKAIWATDRSEGGHRLLAAAATFERLGGRCELARTHLDLAHALAVDGDRDRAERHRHEAGRLLSVLGLTLRPELYRFSLDSSQWARSA